MSTHLGSSELDELEDSIGASILEADRIGRVSQAQEFVLRLEAALQVEDDLKFWVRRIRRAMKFNNNSTDNHWSMRGSMSIYYIAALQKRLGTDFNVQSLRSHFLDNVELVSVSW